MKVAYMGTKKERLYLIGLDEMRKPIIKM